MSTAEGSSFSCGERVSEEEHCACFLENVELVVSREGATFRLDLT